MATLEDAVAIITQLPDVTEGERFRFHTWSVKGKAFAWERPFSKADIKRFGSAPVPDGPILAVAVEDLHEKEAVLASTRKGVFTIPLAGLDRDELEMTLIEAGADDIQEQDDELLVYTSFTDFISVQRALETAGVNVTNAELRRIPNSTVKVTDEQAEDVIKIIDKLEEDDDVQNVYHNMAEE